MKGHCSEAQFYFSMDNERNLLRGSSNEIFTDYFRFSSLEAFCGNVDNQLRPTNGH